MESLINPDLAVDDIYITLGSPWVPTDVIDDFIAYMALGEDPKKELAQEYHQINKDYDYAVRHDAYTGWWEIPNKTRFRKSQHHRAFQQHAFRKQRVIWRENEIYVPKMTPPFDV